ncbi:MAG: SpoIIE family protein phosphatase [bacterium]|nr:SpoIIE family protein phosphatase [bacterium]
MNKPLSTTGILIFIFLYPGALFSVPGTIFTSGFNEQSIQNKIEILEDPEGVYTIKDFIVKNNISGFERNTKNITSFGYSSSVYWLRFTVENNRGNMDEFYLKFGYPHLDYIDFYFPGINNDYIQYTTGDTLPFKQRMLTNKTFIFKLNIPAGKQKTYYLRLESKGSIRFPLSIITREYYIHNDHNDQAAIGIYFGILLLIIIYNLFLFTSIREKIYLYYILHVLFIALHQAKYFGTAFEYLWPGIPLLNNTIDIFSGAQIFMWLGLFLKEFLNTKENTPKLNTVLSGFIIIQGVFSFTVFVVPRTYILHLSSILPILVILCALIIGFVCLKKGVRQARYFLLAWTAALGGTILLTAHRLGLLPMVPVTQYGVQIGIILNAILLSFGLADRINVMKAKLEDLNINLENKVEERTNELLATKEEVESMNDYLKETNDELIYARNVAERDMRMAINVQLNFLPKNPPIAEQWDIAFAFKPMAGVSGDFYDFFEFKKTLHGAAIFDVSGHGIASGLVTMIARSIIYRCFKAGLADPLETVISRINNELQNEIGFVDNYLTGILLRMSENRIEYINAAHPDPILKRKNEVTQILDKEGVSTAGAFLGVMGFYYNYEALTISVQKDDCILIYTDGILEERNRYNEQFGTNRLLESLNKAPGGSSNEVLDSVMSDFYSFTGRRENFSDDITLIVIKKK